MKSQDDWWETNIYDMQQDNMRLQMQGTEKLNRSGWGNISSSLGRQFGCLFKSLGLITWSTWDVDWILEALVWDIWVQALVESCARPWWNGRQAACENVTCSGTQVKAEAFKKGKRKEKKDPGREQVLARDEPFSVTFMFIITCEIQLHLIKLSTPLINSSMQSQCSCSEGFLQWVSWRLKEMQESRNLWWFDGCST